MTSQSSVNTTWSNQQLLVELENVLDRHSRRIDLLDERSERAREHRSRTVGDVEGLEEKVSRVENKLQRNEGKLAQMQVGGFRSYCLKDTDGGFQFLLTIVIDQCFIC